MPKHSGSFDRKRGNESFSRSSFSEQNPVGQMRNGEVVASEQQFDQVSSKEKARLPDVAVNMLYAERYVPEGVVDETAERLADRYEELQGAEQRRNAETVVRRASQDIVAEAARRIDGLVERLGISHADVVNREVVSYGKRLREQAKREAVPGLLLGSASELNSVFDRMHERVGRIREAFSQMRVVDAPQHADVPVISMAAYRRLRYKAEAAHLDGALTQDQRVKYQALLGSVRVYTGPDMQDVNGNSIDPGRVVDEVDASFLNREEDISTNVVTRTESSSIDDDPIVDDPTALEMLPVDVHQMYSEAMGKQPFSEIDIATLDEAKRRLEAFGRGRLIERIQTDELSEAITAEQFQERLDVLRARMIDGRLRQSEVDAFALQASSWEVVATEKEAKKQNSLWNKFKHTIKRGYTWLLGKQVADSGARFAIKSGSVIDSFTKASVDYAKSFSAIDEWVKMTDAAVELRTAAAAKAETQLNELTENEDIEAFIRTAGLTSFMGSVERAQSTRQERQRQDHEFQDNLVRLVDVRLAQKRVQEERRRSPGQFGDSSVEVAA